MTRVFYFAVLYRSFIIFHHWYVQLLFLWSFHFCILYWCTGIALSECIAGQYVFLACITSNLVRKVCLWLTMETRKLSTASCFPLRLRSNQQFISSLIYIPRSPTRLSFWAWWTSPPPALQWSERTENALPNGHWPGPGRLRTGAGGGGGHDCTQWSQMHRIVATGSKKRPPKTRQPGSTRHFVTSKLRSAGAKIGPISPMTIYFRKSVTSLALFCIEQIAKQPWIAQDEFQQHWPSHFILTSARALPFS